MIDLATVRRKLRGVAIFLGVVWGVFLLELVVSSCLELGLRPRSLLGLAGIVTMPFLHDGLWHLLGNTFPLAALLALLVVSRDRPWTVVAALTVCGGALLWLVGRSTLHVGASGLIMGLIVFLIVVGFIERRPVSLIIAVLVLFFYGGAVLWSVLPFAATETSWDGHLCGALGGGLVAYVWTRPRTVEWLAQHEFHWHFRFRRPGPQGKRRHVAKPNTLAR